MTTPVRPTGEVTFLFTDVEGSTRLVQALGASGWAPVLSRHRELIRAALAAHGGQELQVEGDGFFAVFADAPAALDAVVDAQRALGAEPWPAAATVRVRMGLHTGEGVLDAEGLYVGPDVHRAARVRGRGTRRAGRAVGADGVRRGGGAARGRLAPGAGGASPQGPQAGAAVGRRDRRAALGLPADPVAGRPPQQPAHAS